MKTGPLGGHSAEVTAVDFSSNGSNVASSSQDGTIHIWDVFTGEVSREID